jgi:intracellular septation protein
MLDFLKVFRPIVADFLSTIVFIVTYEVTGNIIIATSLGIAAGVAQFLWLRLHGRPIALMQYAGVALVIVLGSATILTKDPRFVMLKPSIAGFAIACVMLQRGWQLRYMPPLAKQHASEGFLVMWGYIWSALYFAVAAANLYVALKLGVKAWAEYNATVSWAAPLTLFFIQYTTMRVVVARNIRARIASGTMAAPAE